MAAKNTSTLCNDNADVNIPEKCKKQVPYSSKKHLLVSDKLRIALTNHCNLSCFYCHNEGQPHNAAPIYISTDYVRALVNWITAENIAVNSINLTGGEPLLHPNLLEIIDLCATVTPMIRVNTNGILLTEALIDSLHTHGVYALKIGVDALFSNQSKPTMAGERINISHLKSIIQYAASKMRVVLNIVVTAFNKNKIDDIIDFALLTGVPRVKIIRLHDFDSRELNCTSLPEYYKTNQPDRDCYYLFFQEYQKKAYRIDYHPEIGRTDMWFSFNGHILEIRFCEDICDVGACGNMFTEVTADGDLLLCSKKHLTVPLALDKETEEIKRSFFQVRELMCNTFTNQKILRGNQYD